MRVVAAKRGDTIIEVLLAVTVFSLVAVGALTVMNRGLNTAEQALEITQVKQQIDSQAAALRAAHQAYVAGGPAAANWQAILNQVGPTNSTGTSLPTTTVCPAIPMGAFAMNQRTGTLVTNPQPMQAASPYPYAGVWFSSSDQTANPQAYGVWIEATRDTVGGFRAARDFTIHACWSIPGSSVPQTLETLVRLYEP